MLGVRPAGAAGDTPERRGAGAGQHPHRRATTRSPSSCPAPPRWPCRSAGPSRLDVAGILAALDRYPYGCAEQLTSRALPLVYLDEVAVSVGIAATRGRRAGAEGDRRGARQAGGERFVRPVGADRHGRPVARRLCHRLPHAGRATRAMTCRRSPSTSRSTISPTRLPMPTTSTIGGEDIAYALYVLARTGRAAIGDLRYYAESKLDNFSTPLAKAQIGAALALYGDKPAGQHGLRGGARRPQRRDQRDGGGARRLRHGAPRPGGRADAGGRGEAGRGRHQGAGDADRRHGGGEERDEHAGESWMLLAAAAFIKDAAEDELCRRRRRPSPGRSTDSSTERGWRGRSIIGNEGSESLDAVVATTGVPTMPEPAGGNGFTITRAYYTPDGEERDIATVAQNDRFIVVVTVTATERPRGQGAGGRSDPGRFRDREPEHLGERRHVQLWLAEVGTRRGPHRGAHGPLRRRVQPDSQAIRSNSASPTRAGGVAGQFRAARRVGRGHVPARAFAPTAAPARSKSSARRARRREDAAPPFRRKPADDTRCRLAAAIATLGIRLSSDAVTTCVAAVALSPVSAVIGFASRHPPIERPCRPCPRRRRSRPRPWCSTGTTGCSGRSPSPTGAGGCRSTKAEVDPHFLEMLIAYEDRRFYEHDGIDWRAMVRAAGQFVLAGGSRLGRLDADHAGRPPDRRRPTQDLDGKLRQIAMAARWRSASTRTKSSTFI